MHFDSLEHRRLMAASATLKDGVLAVVGTNESDKIQISAAYQFKVGENNKATTSVASYGVSLNGKTLGSFKADDVKRINIFALGGNDSIIGLQGGTTSPRAIRVSDVVTGRNPDGSKIRLIDLGNGAFRVAAADDKVEYVSNGGHGVIKVTTGSGTGTVNYTATGGTIVRTADDGNIYVVNRPASGSGDTLVVSDYSAITAPLVPMYVEGGSGNDFVQGGNGNDTLKGGRGDDVLIGGAGVNRLYGESGDDTFNATRIAVSGSAGFRLNPLLDANGRNILSGGAGRDLANLSFKDTANDDVELKGYTTSSSLVSRGGTIRLAGGTSDTIVRTTA